MQLIGFLNTVGTSQEYLFDSKRGTIFRLASDYNQIYSEYINKEKLLYEKATMAKYKANLKEEYKNNPDLVWIKKQTPLLRAKIKFERFLFDYMLFRTKEGQQLKFHSFGSGTIYEEDKRHKGIKAISYLEEAIKLLQKENIHQNLSKTLKVDKDGYIVAYIYPKAYRNNMIWAIADNESLQDVSKSAN